MSKCNSCGVDWTNHLGITGTCKRVQEQAAENDKLKSNWISVDNQLPPIDRRVLFCCAIVCDFSEVDIGQFDAGWMGSKNAVAMELDGGDWGPCSHWRELPEPPKK